MSEPIEALAQRGRKRRLDGEDRCAPCHGLWLPNTTSRVVTAVGLVGSRGRGQAADLRGVEPAAECKRMLGVVTQVVGAGIPPLIAYGQQPDEVAELLKAAGFDLLARAVREPEPGVEPVPQGYLLANRAA